ncbi:MAG: polysaccharide biosynthesis protein [Clostridiales bacterium]|jgi:stage V sporulation protein B|nr:polysaccharide biosynthesis protein [Clostridiales bacterium]
MRRKSLVAGALILTAAGVLTRILGFVYRIYMSNIMGAEGMGLYQLILPVYGLAWSIACSGFSTTISKVIAAERVKGEYGNMGRVLKQSVAITSAIGVALSLALYFCADVVGIYFFQDMRTITALRILSIAFPFMAAGTCVRGYFLGLQETLVPAVNQVLEQCVRMIVIFFLAGYFIPRGLEYACVVSVIGIVCEEFISFLYIFLSYRSFKRKNKLTKRPSLSPRASLSLILGMAMPLTANRVCASLLATLENVLIPQRLQAFGMTADQAIGAFGQMSGMAMPLIYFPTALLTSLSITLVPTVSEAVAVNQLGKIRETISKSMLFTTISGMGAASLFLTFPDQLGMVIYHQPIGQMLFILGLMCPFLYIQIIFSGILNGLGHQMFIFKVSLLSSCISILFIYFLVPLRGVNAFILGWFVSLTVSCTLEMNKIYDSIHLDLDAVNWVFKPALAAAAAGLSMKWLGAHFLFPLFGSLFGLVIGATLLGLMFCGLIMLTGVIDKSDLNRILKRRGASKAPA